MPKYSTGADVKKTYGVSNQALRQWANAGKIKTVRTPGGNRLYDSEDIDSIFGKEEKIRTKVCYARVSSERQKADLDRQVEMLRQFYPDSEIITDIGSGLNFKRPGFIGILERVMRGEISQICVLYRDRLCRFGIELVEFICQKHDTTIVVHSYTDKIEVDNTKELAEDLLSIVTVFVARNNGLRAAENRRNRKTQQDSKIEIGNSAGEKARGESHPNKIISESETETNTEGLVFDGEVDI